MAEATLDKYPQLVEVYWVQDEPANMGACQFVIPKILTLIAGTPVGARFISRAESASPATGSHKAHVIEQQDHNRLIRPRALYTGPAPRTYVPLDRRG